MLYIGLGILIILFLALLYFAYVYSPKSMEYESEYLSMIDSQYAELDGYNAHYIKMGEGEPVIFIHGGGSWLYSFRDNLPYFSEEFSAYGIDMPGHGYTEVLQENV